MAQNPPKASRSPPLTTLPNCGLPPELWLHISDLATTPDHPIFITFTTPRSTVADLVRQPPLLRTCTLFRSKHLPLFYSSLIVMLIGDTELPRCLEGRTGAMPPNLQAWLTAIGLENRERLGRVFISHFREIPVRGGWIDGSIIKYTPVLRPGWELFGRWAREVDEGGFVFRPWTVRVEFETRRIVLVDSRQRAEMEGRAVEECGGGRMEDVS